jgi:hypothetical protein
VDSWPADLPQDWYLADNGPDYKPVDNTIRTSVMAGPAKARRKFTSNVENLTLTGTLDRCEYKLLKDFVQLTLKEVLPFGWKHFITDGPATYRFPAGWSSVEAKHLGGDIWTVSLQLEMLSS